MDQVLKSPGARRLRLWGVGLPIALVVALQFFCDAVLRPRIGAAAAGDISGFLTVAGVVVFALVIWRMLEHAECELTAVYRAARQHEKQLVALHEAALSVTSALDLPTVLRRVVEESRTVIGTRYGALAVLSADGAIEEFITAGIDKAAIERLGAPPTGHGLLGLVISDPQPLRVENIGTHPQSVGFPPNHPPMRTLLAVPLSYQGTVVGSLYVTDREDGRAFDAADQETLERFGAQAATAVANARLYGEVERLSLVEERERISMDLHDGVLQTLYATGLGLEAVLEDVDIDPVVAKDGIERAIRRLHGTIGDIRHYIFDLRSAQEQTGDGLPALLRRLVDGLQHPGVDITVEADAPPAELPKRVQWECWHVAREAMSNALRHGGCTLVAVTLGVDAAGIRLRVADDGVGFDPHRPAGDGHRGLRNMQRRAEVIGARMEVASAPGRGTTVTLHVPLAAEGGSQ